MIPIVAMKRMMSGWLMSGRSTTRSIPTARRNITTSVPAKATQAGSPRAWSPTSVSAAKTTMMPCAKLKMREERKISTKPSAMSA